MTTVLPAIPDSNAQSTTLMDLPRELRDIIYTEVFDFNHTVDETNTKEWQIRRGADHPVNIRLTPISFNWLDLMRTNGCIADEMRQNYNIPSLHKDPSQQTWRAKVTLNDDKLTLTWTSLPCPSSSVRHLDVDFKINFRLSKFGHWDSDANGEPGSIFQGLFQLLNQITHRGPNIASPEILPHPISFETLNLKVSFPDESSPFSPYAAPERIYILEYGKRRIYGRLLKNLITASGCGFLSGRVGRIEVTGPKSQGSLRTDIQITEDGRDEKTEEEWRKLGFYWGLDVQDTCVAV